MTVKVLYKEPGKVAELREIEDDAGVIREMIGGCFAGYFVRSFVPYSELSNVAIYCHDEGKLIGLPANCFIGSELLVGNVIFYAYDSEGNGMDLTLFQAALLAYCLRSAPWQ